MVKFSQNELAEKYRSARKDYSKGNYSSSLRLLHEIKNDIDIPDTENILLETDKLIEKINKIKGLKRSRWILSLTTVIVFLFFVIGLITRPNKSFVTIDVFASQLELSLGEKLISNPVSIIGLDMSGMNDINLNTRSIKMSVIDSGNQTQWVELSNTMEQVSIRKSDISWSIFLESDYLILEDLIIADSSNVIINKRNDAGKEISIIVEKGEAVGTIDTDNHILMSCNSGILEINNKKIPIDGAELKIELENARIIFDKMPNNILMLSFEIQDQEERANDWFSGKNMLIHDINFKKYRNEFLISSISKESQLQFNDFENKIFKVYPNEFLTLGRLDNFQITDIDISNNLRLRGAGYVKEASIGNDLNQKNCVPNNIEWLIENEKVKLIIALLFPVLSVISALLYRLKILDEN